MPGESGSSPMNFSFADWLTHVFNRPAATPAWYFRPHAVTWDAPPDLTASHIIETFERAGETLRPYSDAQVAQGLKYIVDPSCGNVMVSVFHDGVSRESEARLIRSLESLFAHCFAPRCTPDLSNGTKVEVGPLNLVCYMWWDVFPWHGHPNEPRFQERDEELLRVMGKTLRIPHDGCREAGLHGLGHWQQYYPAHVKKIVDGFLTANPSIRPELRQYASNALSGCVN